KKIKIQQKDFFLCLFLFSDISGEANVAFDPSFRGLLPRFYRSPGAQRLGPGSSEGRRPSLHQRQCRARCRVRKPTSSQCIFSLPWPSTSESRFQSVPKTLWRPPSGGESV